MTENGNAKLLKPQQMYVSWGAAGIMTSVTIAISRM
jgi:hypothetical protein